MTLRRSNDAADLLQDGHGQCLYVDLFGGVWWLHAIHMSGLE